MESGTRGLKFVTRALIGLRFSMLGKSLTSDFYKFTTNLSKTGKLVWELSKTCLNQFRNSWNIVCHLKVAKY